MIVEDILFDFDDGPIIPTSTSQVEIDHEYGYDGALAINRVTASQTRSVGESRTLEALPAFTARILRMAASRPSAMAVGVSDRLWSMEELIECIDAIAPAQKPRGPNKKLAA